MTLLFFFLKDHKIYKTERCIEAWQFIFSTNFVALEETRACDKCSIIFPYIHSYIGLYWYIFIHVFNYLYILLLECCQSSHQLLQIELMLVYKPASQERCKNKLIKMVFEIDHLNLQQNSIF
jgi:hypothetical protein